MNARVLKAEAKNATLRIYIDFSLKVVIWTWVAGGCCERVLRCGNSLLRPSSHSTRMGQLIYGACSWDGTSSQVLGDRLCLIKCRFTGLSTLHYCIYWSFYSEASVLLCLMIALSFVRKDKAIIYPDCAVMLPLELDFILSRRSFVCGGERRPWSLCPKFPVNSLSLL